MVLGAADALQLIWSSEELLELEIRDICQLVPVRCVADDRATGQHRPHPTER